MKARTALFVEALLVILGGVLGAFVDALGALVDALGDLVDSTGALVLFNRLDAGLRFVLRAVKCLISALGRTSAESACKMHMIAK